MFTKRIIPCLDVNAGRVVKGVKFVDLKDAGDPVEIAKIIEDSGAAAVAVHGRTRQQYYAGEADWDTIRRVKEAITIPVIGNGDVDSPLKAEALVKQTGCDAVMVGRAVRGNPWLLSLIHISEPTRRS